jgi:hypothetical protein
MLTTENVVDHRILQTDDELSEARLEAVGFVYHGRWPAEGQPAPRGGVNLLHFARCAKLDKATEVETKVWFRTIKIANHELNQTMGAGRWKWCKICQREITQRILNES